MRSESKDWRTRRKILQTTGLGLAAALSGCVGGGGGGDGGGGSTDADGSTPQNSDGSGGTASGGGGSQSMAKVQFWFTNFDNPNVEDANEWYFNHMEEEFDVEIVPSSFSYSDMRQKFLTGSKTGVPDVTNGSLSHLAEYSKADLIEPISDRAKQMDWYGDFADGALNACKYQGELYGLPMIGGGRVLLYRTDVLDEYGFEPPETLKDLVEIGTEITKNEDGMYGFLNTTKQGQVRAFQEFMTHMFQMGDGVFTLEDGEWSVTTTPDDIGKVFKWFYHDMYNGDGATPANPDARGSDWQAVDIGYLQGNHAMAEGGNWVWGFTDRAPDAEQAKEILKNTGAAKIPNAPGAADPMSTWLGATPTMLSANSDAPEAAWTALREHASPTMIEKYGQTSSKFLGPPMITSLDSVYTREDRQFLNESVKTGKSISFVSWGKPREALYSEMQQVVYDRKDPFTAGEDLHAAFTEMTSEFKV